MQKYIECVITRVTSIVCKSQHVCSQLYDYHGNYEVKFVLRVGSKKIHCSQKDATNLSEGDSLKDSGLMLSLLCESNFSKKHSL